MTTKEFEQVVNYVIDNLPSEFKNRLDNVDIFVTDLPSRQQLARSNSSHPMNLLGLYEGVPQTRRRNYGIGGPLPDRITIFRIPIVNKSKTKIGIIKQIRSTLLHEIAHHFGMDEQSVRNSVKKRKIG